MQIQYKILNYIPQQASLVVNYFTDDVPEGLTYTLDVPIVDGVLANEEEIIKLIETYVPRGQLERMVHLKNVEHPDHLTNFITSEGETVETTRIDGDEVQVTRRDVAKLQLTLAIQRVLADMAGATV